MSQSQPWHPGITSIISHLYGSRRCMKGLFDQLLQSMTKRSELSLADFLA